MSPLSFRSIRATSRVSRPEPFGRPRSRSPLFWLGVVVITACTGLIYDVLFADSRVLPSIVYAVTIGTSIVAFEYGALFGQVQARLRGLPTWAYVPLAELAYMVIITLAHVVAGVSNWSTGLVGGPIGEALLPTPPTMLYALAASAVVVFMIRLRDLIGSEIFVNLLIGRYWRPIEEERIFLFVDIVGSTAFAERNGDLAAQAYLAAFFAAIAAPVRRRCGSIDDYIGDMALVTWPLSRGSRDARCVACVFDMLGAIAADEEGWLRRFGQVPRFRAALHGGPVVTAEIGVDRHKISFFGDTVNATARIEALCRRLGADILISADLLRRLPALGPAIEVRPMGDHAVTGRNRSLTVFALASPVYSRQPVAPAHDAAGKAVQPSAGLV